MNYFFLNSQQGSIRKFLQCDLWHSNIGNSCLLNCRKKNVLALFFQKESTNTELRQAFNLIRGLVLQFFFNLLSWDSLSFPRSTLYHRIAWCSSSVFKMELLQMRVYSGSPGLFYAMLPHNNCIRKVWQRFTAVLSLTNGWYPVANDENCFCTEADSIGLLTSFFNF